MNPDFTQAFQKANLYADYELSTPVFYRGYYKPDAQNIKFIYYADLNGKDATTGEDDTQYIAFEVSFDGYVEDLYNLIGDEELDCEVLQIIYSPERRDEIVQTSINDWRGIERIL